MSEQVDWKQLEQQLSSAVKLSRRPVAVSFVDAVPGDVNAFEGTEPAGCSFWRLAAAGRVFYTDVGEDELYFVLRGKDVPVVADALTVIISANTALHDYAKSRRLQLATI